ncbi:PREDICTED: synaptic vesicular amine transporter-like [Wasmannia auropunctata]|uniref:synaptic vesicular amine transporter-like n=1 Tax=Wasmannia auropunctata TaxID=64793 RepID=UPI0005F0AA72|nr:PREDICTED: synaptic vesicular amine transporter-like [Wasmannia auropunctata]XP_011697499.1 PREDICTED: synaptic vesicular amine transporter-like [Wasmannia auropunctata]
MRLDLKNSRMITVVVVYLSLFLDNVLLTVVVPIIPDYLCTLDANTTASAEEDENGRVGLLLSSKALVQLILNPAVGTLTGTLGYARPLFLGNLSLLLAALLFAFGQTYEILFLARSIQGIASACIAVSGMSLVASQYSEEDERSKIMGFVLGSIALGVLLGYPIGSVLYDLEGKMAPFLLVSSLIVVLICLQILKLDVQTNIEPNEQQTTWLHLLSNPHILIISGAIWCSTSPMAILEPCLPIWLRTHIKPKKWQLGTVFIPDSVGYLIGTNFFGVIAYRYGRSKVAILAIFVVGVSAILIPLANTMSQLIFPHLGMGLGIGVADAALVPLLASLVDRNGNYGPVYSIQQVAVSLAYSLGPITGGEMVKAIGFPWVMRVVGIVNIAYCPLLIYLTLERKKLLAKKEGKKDYDTFQKSVTPYERFHDSDEDL